jgi:NADH-quinone oxidoreductase subunit A
LPADFLPIVVLLALATGIAFLVVAIGHLFGPRRPSNRKGQTYESGMVPYGPGQRRVPVRFYLIAVLFILFDIETVFLLPWAVVMRQTGVAGLVQIGLFVIILGIGFFYAWKKGALEWE